MKKIKIVPINCIMCNSKVASAELSEEEVFKGHIYYGFLCGKCVPVSQSGEMVNALPVAGRSKKK